MVLKFVEKPKCHQNYYCFRYTAKGFPEFPKCQHTKGALLCRTLSAQDIRIFHSSFYKEKNKVYQDNFILKHLCMQPVKRRRPKNNKNKIKEARAKYFIRNHGKVLVPVCLATFLKVLHVSRFRVTRIAERFYNTGEMPKERRGGDTTGNKSKAKKENIFKFLNKLTCSETHYCANTSGRKYLPSELNIRKLWKMYSQDTEAESLQVKETYFRYIFNRCYNLGFGSPRVDVCSTCLQLSEKIKTCRDEEQKNILFTEKRVHKLRSQAFYDLLKENKEHVLIISFDCQKNQPLPKLPDQSTYYSRQLYLNHFCVVKGHSKSKLTKENVTSYVWTENEYAKGSNEIASCLFDYLNSIDMTPYTIVRLISDGCGGQNKNSILISMLSNWFRNASNDITEVQLVFPMTGHSFIPPDRIFGNIEKQIKLCEIIIDPNQYIEMISNFATVKRLGTDVNNRNWKTAVEANVKQSCSWHFGIQSCKRVYLTKKITNSVTVLVQGETTYRLQSEPSQSARSITKRGKSLELRAEVIPKGNYVKKEAKKRDVDSLLRKHYGEDWKTLDSLHFFKHVIDGPEIDVNAAEEVYECSHVEEPGVLQI